MKITIIGAGNAGLTHAAMIAKRGHSVTIVKTTRLMYEDSFEELRRTKQIEYEKDGGKGAVGIEEATRDLPRAVSQADVILVLTQSVAHENLSEWISPHLRRGQILLVSPGYAGSFYFSEKCKGKGIVFAEGESLPFDSRIVGPGKVRICFENIRNPIGVFPSIKTGETLMCLKEILPGYVARQDVLESAFHNPNLIVHIVGAIMSVGRIEFSKGEFWMYREAFTPTIWNMVEDLDSEKKAILEYFELPAQSFAESFQLRTSHDLSADPMQAFRHYAQFGSPKGPGDARTRYITEDVPMGLCFMSSIGKKANIPTPVCDALIAIASSMHQKDYYAKGRTLGQLGIGHYSVGELKSILKEGFTSEPDVVHHASVPA
ncbi:MAG: NAD/NADP octopine/nopaline dehydrogenase family protein [Nitrospinaceae bacterium]